MNTDPLKLRQLPQLAPPTGLWSAIESDLAQQRKRPRWPISASAVAAVLVLSVSLIMLLRAPDPSDEQGLAGTLPRPVQAAMAVSADLESELSWRRYAGVSGNDIELLVLLETELAWLDLRLTEQPDDLSLWQQRSQLLGEMIQRYTDPIELTVWSGEQI